MAQPFLVGGEWRRSDSRIDIHFPYDGSLAGSVCLAGPQDVQDAIAAAKSSSACAIWSPNVTTISWNS